MIEKTFVMSKYASLKNLLRDKADYYEHRCEQLESVLKKILVAHEQNRFDWHAMWDAKELMDD